MQHLTSATSVVLCNWRSEGNWEFIPSPICFVVNSCQSCGCSSRSRTSWRITRLLEMSDRVQNNESLSGPPLYWRLEYILTRSCQWIQRFLQSSAFPELPRSRTLGFLAHSEVWACCNVCFPGRSFSRASLYWSVRPTLFPLNAHSWTDLYLRVVRINNTPNLLHRE